MLWGWGDEVPDPPKCRVDVKRKQGDLRTASAAKTTTTTRTTTTTKTMKSKKTAKRGHRRFHFRWKRVLLVDPGKPSSGSWLLDGEKKGGRRVGKCMFCEDFPGTNRLVNLRRHGRSLAHRTRVEKALGRPVQLMPGPSTSQFHQVLELRKAAVSHRGSTKLGAKKSIKLTWCLAEAVKQQERTFLARACSIALNQDCRGNLLAVRYFAIDSRLNQREGLLGMKTDWGTNSNSLRDATEAIIREACTRYGSPPSGTKPRRTPLLDRKTFNHIIEHVELVTADCANDEQRAIRAMAGQTTAKTLFPALLAKGRDRCHAAARPGP